jgi:hypothetical protein
MQGSACLCPVDHRRERGRRNTLSIVRAMNEQKVKGKMTVSEGKRTIDRRCLDERVADKGDGG